MKSTYDLFTVENSGNPQPFTSLRINSCYGGDKRLWAFTGNHVTVSVDGKELPNYVLHMFSSRRINVPGVFLRRAHLKWQENLFLERTNLL